MAVAAAEEEELVHGEQERGQEPGQGLAAAVDAEAAVVEARSLASTSSSLSTPCSR